MARLKSLRKGQKKNSMEADDIAAAATATLAGGSAPDTIETGETTEEPDRGTTIAK